MAKPAKASLGDSALQIHTTYYTQITHQAYQNWDAHKKNLMSSKYTLFSKNFYSDTANIKYQHRISAHVSA